MLQIASKPKKADLQIRLCTADPLEFLDMIPHSEEVRVYTVFSKLDSAKSKSLPDCTL